VISEKRESNVIHILRNPYGYSNSDVREARLDAAKLIENYKDAYLNMRKFAEDNGLDTVACCSSKLA
jgi:hypothetical protein